MRILGVLDLSGGRAVHARAGRRELYAPVREVAGEAIEPGDAGALATIYRERLGIDELYAADLDAILGGPPQRTLVTAVARVLPLSLDAGIASADAARAAVDSGASIVVVGLETLDSFAALEEISAAIGRNRLAFSLDLRDGRPLHRQSAIEAGTPPVAIARRAVQAGAATIIVIDLARVGTGAGLDVELLERLRHAIPEVSLIAGGGTRGRDDLCRLAAAGCDGVLVASALHDGRLNAADIAAARELQRSVSR